jgi:hypothetical protein
MALLAEDGFVGWCQYSLSHFHTPFTEKLRELFFPSMMDIAE